MNDQEQQASDEAAAAVWATLEELRRQKEGQP